MITIGPSGVSPIQRSSTREIVPVSPAAQRGRFCGFAANAYTSAGDRAMETLRCNDS